MGYHNHVLGYDHLSLLLTYNTHYLLLPECETIYLASMEVRFPLSSLNKKKNNNPEHRTTRKQGLESLCQNN